MTHKRLLSRVCLAGAALTLLFCGFTVYVFVCSGRSFFPPRGGEPAFGESFHQKLLKYDAFAAAFPPFKDLVRALDALEKDALGTESHLSALKRRRALARNGIAAGNTYDWGAYLAAAERSAAKFPGDEMIMAAASEAAVLAGYPEKAWEYASGITQKSLLPLAFGAAVLAGALETPEKAAALERSGELFLSIRENDPVRNRERFIINAAIVRILTGDVRGAGILIPALLGVKSGPESAAEKALNFAAEYYYDFGDPERAAEIFVRLGGEADLGRAADALALAGKREHAKGLWIVLASPDENGFIVTPSEILVRSLYNMASVAETPEEELTLVRRAISIDPEHLYSLIRYSRFLPTEEALTFLDNENANQDKPLAALESLKRRRGNWPVEKIIPETWFLINRYEASALNAGEEPGAAILYRWACYYFDFQKKYDESARLIRNAERNGIGGPWRDFHRALALLRKNEFAEGETLLLGIEERYGRDENRTVAGNPDGIFWQVPANLGRIREAAQSFQTALDYYENAADRVSGKADAARICYRIARCLRSLGRDREARDALERGLSLDGENMAIRLELTRLNESGIF
jgi:tetratricopeptide (TPR) repeat protein